MSLLKKWISWQVGIGRAQIDWEVAAAAAVGRTKEE